MENFPELPDVEEHGWMKGEYFLEPRWCDGEVLPEELTSLLEESNENEEEEPDIEQETDNSDSSEDEDL